MKGFGGLIKVRVGSFWLTGSAEFIKCAKCSDIENQTLFISTFACLVLMTTLDTKVRIKRETMADFTGCH